MSDDEQNDDIFDLDETNINGEVVADRSTNQNMVATTDSTGRVINFEDVTSENISKLPYNMEMFEENIESVAMYFLREFETPVKFKAPDKNYVTKPVKKYVYDIRRMITRDIKIITIDHMHFADYMSDYRGRIFSICEKHGFEQSTVNLDMLNTQEMRDLIVYMYTKKLMEYLEGTQVQEYLDIMRKAILSLLTKDLKFDIYSDSDTEKAFKDMHVAIKNFPREFNIHEINSTLLNKAAMVKGNLMSYDDKRRVEIIKSWWMCHDCNESFPMPGTMKPNKCKNPMCGEKGNFTEMSEKFENMDFIYIKVQQHMNTDSSQVGVTDLVVKIQGNNLISYFYDRMKPAANLKVTGIVKLAHDKNNRQNPNERLIQLHACTIEIEGENTVMQYNERLLDIIANRIHPDHIEEHFQKLCRSVCPHLYGQELIKTSVLLMYAGAEPRVNNDSRNRVRGDINILLCGDSSQGKSDYGIFTLKVLPQSIRTIGGASTTTKAALTTSVEIINGIKVITFGVLPQCDLRGVAVVDELDKRNKDDFEILSYPLDDNQTIPTHKSGFHHEVNARCPALLIGNPSKKHGKWDISKTIFEQTNFASWLLSRVDLVFIMYDDGDMKRKETMIDHIAKSRSKMVIESDFDKNFKNKTYSDIAIEKVENDLLNNRFEGVYDTEYLRHELHYLKTNYKPLLKTNSAADLKLKKEYLKLSQISMPTDFGDGEIVSNPMMDTRKYNSLERLSMAAARLRRHHVVTEEDVDTALLLMTYSIGCLVPQPKKETGTMDGYGSTHAQLSKMLGESPIKNISRILQSEEMKHKKLLKKQFKTKLSGFNRLLFAHSYNRCENCRGNGTITSTIGVEECWGCHGVKKFDKKFSFNDFQADIINSRIMGSDESKLMFNEYIKGRIVVPEGGNFYKVTMDPTDHVLIGDFVDELAERSAAERTEEAFQKAFGISSYAVSDISRADRLK